MHSQVLVKNLKHRALLFVIIYCLCQKFCLLIFLFCDKRMLSISFREKMFVALKIVKSASHYTETALDEMKLLQAVSYLTDQSCLN